MGIVDAGIGRIIGQFVEEVPDVVEQGGSDKFRRGAGLAGEGGSLEGMLQLRNGFMAVLGMTVLVEKGDDCFYT
jgi:hypothetical protein